MRIKNADSVVAVLCSDLHITNKTPIARAEKDWFEVQARYFEQVNQILSKYEMYNVPLVVAGDFFDKPTPGPDVINFAMSVLRYKTLGVPGQHDLLYHHYSDRLEKTAYGVVVRAGKVIDLDWIEPVILENNIGLWYAVGIPWGLAARSIPEGDPDEPYKKILAVVHSFIWDQKDRSTGYEGCSVDATVGKWKNRLINCDAAVFGDNHKGFSTHTGSHCQIMNCGAFIPRRSDERNYKPRIGLLMEDGTIQTHCLDTSKDEWASPQDIANKVEGLIDTQEFIRELADIETSSLDFKDTIKQVLRNNEVRKPVKEVIYKAMETKK